MDELCSVHLHLEFASWILLHSTYAQGKGNWLCVISRMLCGNISPSAFCGSLSKANVNNGFVSTALWNRKSFINQSCTVLIIPQNLCNSIAFILHWVIWGLTYVYSFSWNGLNGVFQDIKGFSICALLDCKNVINQEPPPVLQLKLIIYNRPFSIKFPCNVFLPSLRSGRVDKSALDTTSRCYIAKTSSFFKHSWKKVSFQSMLPSFLCL